MALTTQFANRLDELWTRRTANLRALVIPRGAGKPAGFSRQHRKRSVNKLLDIATEVLLKRDGKREFKRLCESRFLKRIKGRGLLDRGERLVHWARETLSGPIVYAFWRGRQCLYVGKGKSWKRLRSYIRSAYLYSADCIEVFCIEGRSQVAKAECLATHLFEPRDKRVKPARVKWGKACPICRKHDDIRHELKTLFRMR